MPTRTHWPLIIVLLTAGVLAAAQVGKAAIAAPLLQQDLGLSLAAVSWVVSAYAMLGAVGGLAAGWGVSQLGIRASIIGGMALIGCASLAGALATGGTALLILRVIEGCGLLAVAVAIPMVLRTLATPADSNAVMAMWGAYMPGGTALMMLLGPWLAPLGWQSLWIVYGVLALALVPVLARAVPSASAMLSGAAPPGALLRRPGPLLVAAAFALYTFQFTAISGLLPELLVHRRGMSIAASGAVAAIAVVGNTLGNLSAGALMRFGVPLWSIVVAAFACIGAASVGIFSAETPVLWIAVLATVGLGVTGAIPASIFAASPHMVRQAAVLALLFGLINQCSSIGQFLGPAALGMLVQRFGWPTAPYLIGFVAICGIAIGLALRQMMRAEPTTTTSRGT